jgi:hypothetical protein
MFHDFMKHRSPLPGSQNPSIGTHPEPVEFSPQIAYFLQNSVFMNANKQIFVLRVDYEVLCSVDMYRGYLNKHNLHISVFKIKLINPQRRKYYFIELEICLNCF